MRRRALLTAVATGGAVVAAGCGATGSSCGPPESSFARPRDSWLTVGYAPTNTAHAPAGPTNAERQWQTDREGGDGPRLNGWFSTPVVGDGSVYIATRHIEPFSAEMPGYLVALDDETGEQQWRVELPSQGGGNPALAGDLLLVGDVDGTLHAVSTEGERRWTRALGGAVRTPTVAGDSVYVLDESATVYGFSLDGEQCWQHDPSGMFGGLLGGRSVATDSAPAVDDSSVYVTFLENPGNDGTAHVMAFDHEGNETWTYRVPTRRETPNTPAVVGGVVLATGGDQIHAIDAATGERRWRFVVGHDHTGPPATDGERAYVCAKNLYAIDLADGTEQWRVVNYGVTDGHNWNDSIPFVAQPAVTDDAVYLRAGAFDSSDGSRLWGDLAEEAVVDSRYGTGEYGRRPMVPLSVTEDGLYLAHQIQGVTKLR